jgi:lysophospholipase L1-like esterase
MAAEWIPVSSRVLESAFAGTAAVVADDGIRPLRLHPDLLRRSPEGLALMAEFTSGVRLRLVTAADRLRVEAVFTRYVMAHLGHAVSRAELLAEVGGVVVDRAVADPTSLVSERKEGPLERGPEVASTLELHLGAAEGKREVVIWFPADAGVTLRAVAATGEVRAAAPAPGLRWVHHGSSISHGGDAADARSTWPAQAGRALGAGWTNLGFGGNAMIDPPTARAIARLDADVVTLSFGINIVTGDAMRRRVFVPALHGFLDTVRDAHPGVPIVVISAISCPGFEDLPGPRRIDEHGRLTGTPRPGDVGALSLSDTRDAIAEVLAARTDDPLLAGMDGRELLGPDDVHHLYDGLHPDPAGYDLMARRFVAFARDPHHPLGRAFATLTPAG